MWIIFAFVSAALLGVYDIFKKTALTNNAVIPVLFLNVLFSCLLFLPLIIIAWIAPNLTENTLFYMPVINGYQHALLVIKAFIVLSSWISAYFALKHLPITIASPIKAMQPILTLLGALLIFEEQLNLYQWIGVLVAIFSFFLLSQSGKKEGIHFTNNKWVFFMVLSIIMGAVSGLYDKWIMTQIDRMNVQVWYNYYQLIIMAAILMIFWYPKRKNTTLFHWSKAIPMIAITIVIADFFYYYALSYDNAMISIVSLVRRSSVVVSFCLGAICFKEQNLKTKTIDLVLVLLGMLFIFLGSH